MDQYIVYCFLGLAETEDRKFFLWPQWERCFLLLDELLRPFAKTSSIKSRQAYVIPLKPHKGDPAEMRRVTLKDVPLGRLRWSYDDNKKWSEKLLEQGEHPIRLLHTQIVSSNSKTSPPEIQVRVGNIDSIPGAAYNQTLSLCVVQSLHRARPDGYWHSLPTELAAIIRAVSIGRTERPWWLERQISSNVSEGSSLADANFAKRWDSLDLDDTWQTWEYVR